MSTPKFGEGSPGDKGYRRMALGIGAAIVGLILIFAILAIVF